MRRLAVAALVLVAGAAVALAAETVEVTVDRAKVRSSPSTGASVVTTVAKGTKLELSAKEGDWRKVRVPDGKTGWIHKDLVKSVTAEPTPAAGGTGGSGGGLWGAVKRGFVADRAAGVTASAGGRGLGESGGAGGAADEAAVSRMESLRISPAEVREFIREGGLSPERLP